MKSGRREDGKFAQAFEIVFHHPIVKGEFWKSLVAGLIGWQYKYKSEHPLTLNNPKPRDDKVTFGYDRKIYNYIEFLFFLPVRVLKNFLFKAPEFILVGLYLEYPNRFWFVLAKTAQTFSSPITAVWETAEGTVKRLWDWYEGKSHPDRSWVPGILGTLLHVLLATCIATAYLLLTATFIFSLLHTVGLGSLVVGSVNVANSFGSGQLGSFFVNMLATGGTFFDTSGLLPATSIASTLLTFIVPVAAVRWVLRQIEFCCGGNDVSADAVKSEPPSPTSQRAIGDAFDQAREDGLGNSPPIQPAMQVADTGLTHTAGPDRDARAANSAAAYAARLARNAAGDKDKLSTDDSHRRSTQFGMPSGVRS